MKFLSLFLFFVPIVFLPFPFNEQGIGNKKQGIWEQSYSFELLNDRLSKNKENLRAIDISRKNFCSVRSKGFSPLFGKYWGYLINCNFNEKTHVFFGNKKEPVLGEFQLIAPNNPPIKYINNNSNLINKKSNSVNKNTVKDNFIKAPKKENLIYSSNNTHKSNKNKQKTCSQNIDQLISELLKDYPSYANRVIQRSRKLNRETKSPLNYVLVAGNPEFDPLKNNISQYTPVFPEQTQQVFFTTLEREYFNNKMIETQNYHWLFLTKSDPSWHLVMVFSRLGSSKQGQPPLPPRDTTNGIVGQTIRLWLRDCQF